MNAANEQAKGTFPASASPAAFAVPPGVPADSATAAEVIATLRQVFACTNGGQVLRVYALFTDAFIREFFAQTPLTPEVTAFLAATPRPLPDEQRRIIRGFGDVQILDDGRAGVLIILDEPELHFHGNALIPDLAGWRRERMPELPHTAAFELAPDWLCEVLSPGTMAHDRGAKLPLYRAEGVPFVWLIDPSARLLEVFRLEGKRYALEGTWRDSAGVRAAPFDAIELELGALWER